MGKREAGRQEGRQGCSINSNKSNDCAARLRQELPELGGLATDWYSEGREAGGKPACKGREFGVGYRPSSIKINDSNNKPGERGGRGARTSCRKREGNQTSAVGAQGKQVA